jgi:DNA/RNA non-specific endonuclease
MNEMDDVSRRRAFSVWLRTGRLPRETGVYGVEFKFNPWHDPENGRFTFAGTGHYYGRGSSGQAAKHGRDFLQGRPAHPPRPQGPPAGRPDSGRRPPAGRGTPSTWGGGVFTGGGGGSFGGGGATGDGDWGGEAKKPQARRAGAGLQRMPPGGVAQPPRAGVGLQRRSPRVDVLRPRTVASPQQRSRRVEVQRPGAGRGSRSGSERWRSVERNGYRYEIDDQNRTRRISGEITLNSDQGRSRTAQLAAGGSDRRKNDHGGHYIARRFNGPKEAFNHFAQDGSFNRSDYSKLENEWEREKRLQKRVRVKIEPEFEGGSRRPSALNVWFWIEGEKRSKRFQNEPQETQSAKQRD